MALPHDFIGVSNPEISGWLSGVLAARGYPLGVQVTRRLQRGAALQMVVCDKANRPVWTLEADLTTTPAQLGATILRLLHGSVLPDRPNLPGPLLGPVVAALRSGDPATVVEAIEVLQFASEHGHMGEVVAVPPMWTAMMARCRSAPTADSALVTADADADAEPAA